MNLEDLLTDDERNKLNKAAEESERAKADEARRKRRAGTKYGSMLND